VRSRNTKVYTSPSSLLIAFCTADMNWEKLITIECHMNTCRPCQVQCDLKLTCSRCFYVCNKQRFWRCSCSRWCARCSRPCAQVYDGACEVALTCWEAVVFAAASAASHHLLAGSSVPKGSWPLFAGVSFDCCANVIQSCAHKCADETLQTSDEQVCA
jgi:hypothetical protein